MTKTEKIIRELAATEANGDFYSLAAAELRAIRRFLRDNKAKHRDCARWLDYYRDFVPHDRPRKEKSVIGPREWWSSDDCYELERFAAFCRQVLALNGIVVPQP